MWGFETTKSEVLYLCLEDSFARIQSRLFEITNEAPPTLHFAIMSDTIGNGLEHQIENFIKEHPDTGLIVIDTLQKVRKTVSTNVNPYAADYDDLRESQLSAVILDDLKRVTHLARQEEALFAQHINQKNTVETRKEITRLQTELETMKKRDLELTALFKRLYEDNVLGRIID